MIPDTTITLSQRFLRSEYASIHRTFALSDATKALLTSDITKIQPCQSRVRYLCVYNWHTDEDEQVTGIEIIETPEFYDEKAQRKLDTESIIRDYCKLICGSSISCLIRLDTPRQITP